MNRSDSRVIYFNSETSLRAFLLELPRSATFEVREQDGKPGRYVMYLD